MKNPHLLILLTLFTMNVYAQEPNEKVMENRAREMHRVICLNDPTAWKKFISENYTQALIRKPMKAQVQGDGPSASNVQADTSDPVAAKAAMFKVLHRDFGGSRIRSIKQSSNKLVMELGGDGLSGIFKLTFEKEKPYLIDGLAIEVGNVDR